MFDAQLFLQPQFVPQWNHQMFLHPQVEAQRKPSQLQDEVIARGHDLRNLCCYRRPTLTKFGIVSKFEENPSGGSRCDIRGLSHVTKLIIASQTHLQKPLFRDRQAFSAGWRNLEKIHRCCVLAVRRSHTSSKCGQRLERANSRNVVYNPININTQCKPPDNRFWFDQRNHYKSKVVVLIFSWPCIIDTNNIDNQLDATITVY